MRINHARFVYLVSQQPAFALMIMDALSKRLRASNDIAPSRGGQPMSDRRPSPFKTLLDGEVCTLIQAAHDVYQIRFKNRAANAYLVSRLQAHHPDRRRAVDQLSASSTCLDHVGVTPEKIDMVVL